MASKDQMKATDEQILKALNDLTGDYAPSMQELAKEVGIAVSSLSERLYRLQGKGLIKNVGIARGIRLTKEGKKML